MNDHQERIDHCNKMISGWIWVWLFGATTLALNALLIGWAAMNKFPDMAALAVLGTGLDLALLKIAKDKAMFWQQQETREMIWETERRTKL